MHHLIHHATLMLALASLAAVGGCDDSSGAPPVSATSFAPADGATRVDIRPTLSIAFDGPLDPASVSAAHVTVTSTGFTIPATLAYDDAMHTITVRPRALDHARTYTLAISGLTNTSGRAVGDAHATFKTWVNGLAPSPYASSTLDSAGNVVRSTEFAVDGSIADYTDHEYTGGLRTRSTSYGDPGPDGTWFTADDPWFQQVLRTYDVNGAKTSTTILYPHDPVIEGGTDVRREYQYDATGKVSMMTTIEGNYQGDGILGTADDVFVYTSYTYDSSGRQLVAYSSRGPGADGILFSQDDITGADILVPGTGGAPDLLGSYESPGPDGQWLTTADNELSFRYEKETLDARGNVVHREEYGPTPPINATGLESWTDYVYDEHDNLVTATQVYTEGGPPLVAVYDTSN